MKTRNKYQDEIPNSVFQAIPKAVFAAIAMSTFLNGNDGSGRMPSAVSAEDFLYSEWTLLHQQGIIPQRPPRIVELESLQMGI